MSRSTRCNCDDNTCPVHGGVTREDWEGIEKKISEHKYVPRETMSDKPKRTEQELVERDGLQRQVKTLESGMNSLIETGRLEAYKLLEATTQRDELLAALKWLFGQVESGWLVRNTLRDGDADYHKRMIAFTQGLAKAQAAINGRAS